MRPSNFNWTPCLMHNDPDRRRVRGREVHSCTNSKSNTRKAVKKIIYLLNETQTRTPCVGLFTGLRKCVNLRGFEYYTTVWYTYEA